MKTKSNIFLPGNKNMPVSDNLVVDGTAQRDLQVIFTIRGDGPAYKTGKGRVVPCTSEHLKWMKEYALKTLGPDKDTKFGAEVLSGEAVVTISMKELLSLAFRAARNANKTSRQGVAKAKFNGVRGFRYEQTGQQETYTRNGWKS